MKVALVDDDSALLSHLYELVSSELSRIGDTAHTITTYNSGEEFLEICQLIISKAFLYFVREGFRSPCIGIKKFSAVVDICHDSLVFHDRIYR